MMPETTFDPMVMTRIQSGLVGSLKPVRPLPSDAQLILRLLLLFCVFAGAVAVGLGLKGMHVRSTPQKMVDYSGILVCAAALTVALVQQMIPGARRRLNTAIVLIGAPLVLCCVSGILYRDIDMHDFMALGVPCLRLGSICAASIGVFAWFIVRRGFFLSPLIAMATAGVYAGLAGVAVLAMHCPKLDALHIIVWHFGAMVIAGLGGAFIGMAISRERSRSLSQPV